MSDESTSNRALLIHELMSVKPEWLLGAVDTKEATKITGVPAASLVTLRSVGGGPKYFKPTPRTVRYLRIDLIEWMLQGGIKSNTADAGTHLNVRSILMEHGGRHG